MPTIREQFHTIANWLNKITIAAGCTKELLSEKPLTTMSPEELKTEQEKLIKLLGGIESDAVSADQDIKKTKDYIYKTINPETSLT